MLKVVNLLEPVFRQFWANKQTKIKINKICLYFIFIKGNLYITMVSVSCTLSHSTRVLVFYSVVALFKPLNSVLT